MANRMMRESAVASAKNMATRRSVEARRRPADRTGGDGVDRIRRARATAARQLTSAASASTGAGAHRAAARAAARAVHGTTAIDVVAVAATLAGRKKKNTRMMMRHTGTSHKQWHRSWTSLHSLMNMMHGSFAWPACAASGPSTVCFARMACRSRRLSTRSASSSSLQSTSPHTRQKRARRTRARRSSASPTSTSSTWAAPWRARVTEPSGS